jgi:hypothetical protein
MHTGQFSKSCLKIRFASLLVARSEIKIVINNNVTHKLFIKNKQPIYLFQSLRGLNNELKLAKQ